MITRPAFKSIERVEDLGPRTEDDSYAGQPGWIFHAEREGSYCYGYEWKERGLCVIPLGNCEYTYDTPELAAVSNELIEWAVGEDMFPSFRQAICEELREKIDAISVELMSDRASGDISPDEVDQIDEAIEKIGTILKNVWLNNPKKETV